jgi:hypothetical protein
MCHKAVYTVPQSLMLVLIREPHSRLPHGSVLLKRGDLVVTSLHHGKLLPTGIRSPTTLYPILSHFRYPRHSNCARWMFLRVPRPPPMGALPFQNHDIDGLLRLVMNAVACIVNVKQLAFATPAVLIIGLLTVLCSVGS